MVSLTPEQQSVVDHRGSPLQVIACAGSGKTEAISRRAATLIAEGNKPESIVAFTFTEKAATELKERIYKRVEDLKGETFLGQLAPMFVGTIHAYCFRVLQDHALSYGNYDVLDQHRHAALVSRRFHELELDRLSNTHWDAVEKFLLAADVIGNELLPVAALQGTAIGECYTNYLDLLDRSNLLTFGMIIAKTVEILDNNAGIYAQVTGNLKHLIVDEYQDINPAQEKLIDLLTRAPVELCVVGDDDQAIYQWRGTDLDNILQFTERYRNVRAVKLETNRRSRPAIVDAANEFAQTIPNRLYKTMLPTRTHGSLEVVTWLGETPQAEADVIADHVSVLHEQGWRYGDMAVLFRSVRTSAPPLVDALQSRGISFDCGGRTGLFSHPEIDSFGELFAWWGDFSWRDENFGPTRLASLDRAVAGLASAFDLPGNKRTALKRFFQGRKAYLAGASRRISLVGEFYRHLQVLGVDRIDPDTPVGSARLGAFARFSSILADYEHVTQRGRWDIDADGKRIYRSGMSQDSWFWSGLANFLLHYAKSAYEDFDGEDVHSLDAVSILTVHQAKGLEWPILFLPALSNRRFPSSNTGKSRNWCLPEEVFGPESRRRYEGSDAEERRLFYVALTRAREVVYASSFERITVTSPVSPYLRELADACGDGNIQKQRNLPLPDSSETLGPFQPTALELSFSDLADYEDCGYAYRLSKVFGFERELAEELGYGNAIHHVLRHVAEGARQTGRVLNTDEVNTLVERELFIPFAFPAMFDNMTGSVTRLVQGYVGDWHDDLRRVWATERPFEMRFEGGILTGRADVILDKEGGKADHLAIVDYKASTDLDSERRYARQLAIYAAAGRLEGLQVDAGYVHDLDSSSRESVDVEPSRTHHAVEWATERFDDIVSARYPARAEQEKCNQCDFKVICHHSQATE